MFNQGFYIQTIMIMPKNKRNGERDDIPWQGEEEEEEKKEKRGRGGWHKVREG